MKRIRIIMLLALVLLVGFTSCSSGRKKRERITDPVQQEALRTRDKDIPVDSIFTAKSVRIIASPFKKIAIGKYFSELSAGWKESAEKATREKYAEKLQKEEKMKEEAAKKAAAKASPEKLADSKATSMERLEVTLRDIPADGYSPTLTFYFLVVLIAFVIIFTIRVIKAFFVAPK